VVLDVDGKAVLARVERDAVGDSPGDRDPVMLKAQVPVQPPRVVLLDDEARRALLTPALRPRLGGLAEVALLAVAVELRTDRRPPLS
jgi:hypothetical protein